MIKTYSAEEVLIWSSYKSKAFDMYFEDNKFCVLDIETTGLSPDRSNFILGGLMSFDNDDRAHLKQYFAEDPAEEKELISAYVDEIQRHDILLTYNGRHFDIPFLLRRARHHAIDILTMPYNLDLYAILNEYSSLRKFLPNLKQKTVEAFMGLWQYRLDKISGAESAMLYYQYLSLKESSADTKDCVDLMLLHNRDDVSQLGKLLPILEKTDLHRAMYRLGFPIISGKHRLLVESIRFERRFLKVRGKQTAAPMDFISYGNISSDCFIRFEKSRFAFELSFPLINKADLTILDLLKLPFQTCEELSGSPDFANGYIVFQKRQDIKYMAINLFIKVFLLKVLKKTSEDLK